MEYTDSGTTLYHAALLAYHVKWIISTCYANCDILITMTMSTSYSTSE